MRAIRKTLAAAVLINLALFAPSGASAASDTTAPTLNLPANAAFVRGSTIGAMAPDADTGEMQATSPIQMKARWTASDASGICGYSTRSVYAGSPPGPWSAWGQQTSVSAAVTDYDSQFGGGSMKFLGYEVRARDCANNITQRSVDFRPGVFQESGASFGYFGVTASYTGAWGTSTCTCWSGGSLRKSTAKGARADFVFDYTEPHPVALVMEKAPTRGKAQIFVDGVLRATIDTYASTAQHRSVVWIGTLTGGGKHTVSVVNAGTAGRSRIDVDAVMVSGLSA